LEAGTGRNQSSHDDVFLQSAEVIDLSADRSFSQDARRFLERRSRNEGLGRKRGLGNSQQERASRSRFSTGLLDAVVLFLESELVDLFVDEEFPINNILN